MGENDFYRRIGQTATQDPGWLWRRWPRVFLAASAVTAALVKMSLAETQSVHDVIYCRWLTSIHVSGKWQNSGVSISDTLEV